jgi:Cu2+-exporting ATPase
VGAAEASGQAIRWPQGRVWVANWRHAECVGQAPDALLGVAMDEKMRNETLPALRRLRAQSLRLAVLSGDLKDRVVDFAQRLGGSPPVWVAGAGVGPEGKLEALRAAQSQGQVVAVVGDGINDAPVLAQAHVSFALDQGAPLAQAQADLIVLGGRLEGVPLAVTVARRALRIVRQNLAWAAAYNFVCIPLALLGYLPPWLAGIGMALSSLGVMVNALRINRAVPAKAV